MSSPRILALLPFLVKGALSVAIFRALRARGVEVTIAYCSDASVAYEPDAAEDFVCTGHLVNLSSMSSATRFDLVLAQVIDREIDLVLQIGATQLYHLIPYWKERLPALKIADILYNEVGHTLNHFLYEGCFDAVIVESDFMGAFIARSSRRLDPPVVVVRSGVDLDDFFPVRRCDGLGLKVGYVGRMSDEKNPLGFIELARQLASLNPGLDFEMFGTGPDASTVKERVAASGIADRLRYHGFVAHARDALQQLDVLVLPSKFDGRPVLVMEANACGIPVIAAPVGGVPELVTDGVNGFLMEMNKTEQIHGLLARLQEQPQALQALKAAARTHALEHFSRDRMLEGYASAFAKVAFN